MNGGQRASGTVGADGVAREDDPGAVLPPAGWLVVVALVYGTLAQGAFHRGPFRLVLLLLAAAAVAHGLSRRSWGPAPALGAIGAGAVALSILATAADLRAALPTLALLAGFLVAVGVGAGLRDGAAARLLDGVIVSGLIASATAWVGVALHLEPWGLVVQGIWRGSSTLTYANATAALAGVAFLLAAARLVPSADRLAVLAAYGSAVGLLCSGSRAGGLAVLVGLVVLARRSGVATTARSLVPVALGGAVAAVGLLPSVAAGDPARPFVAALGLVAGGLVAVGLPVDRLRSVRPTGTALGLGAAGVAVLLAVGWAATGELRAARFDARSEDRAAEWGATVDEFGSAPLFGVGPGRLELSWIGPDGVTYVAEYAHNEYLELLATFGLVGLAALVAGVVVVVVMRRRTGGGSPLDDGALAALAVLTVHSGFDFLWHIPVLALVGGVLVGLVARVPSTVDAPPPDPVPEPESVP